jgi:formylglycine-generating enzyme required for sulfatase activity
LTISKLIWRAGWGKFIMLSVRAALVLALCSWFAVAHADDSPAPLAATATNSIGVEFILISAGSFVMGSDPALEKGAAKNEAPPHQVTISQPFYLGKYEVTQAQWEAVMGDVTEDEHEVMQAQWKALQCCVTQDASKGGKGGWGDIVVGKLFYHPIRNPSRHLGANRPVERVSWDDAQEFIRRLNEKEGTNKYRLPTEAEWEYAARAGTTSAWSFGDSATDIAQYAWYMWSGAPGVTHPVGRKKPNPWGLYDMHGNVWEWVQDSYSAYHPDAVTDPQVCTEYTRVQILRGGSAGAFTNFTRSAARFFGFREFRDDGNGFRLAFSSGG